MANSILLLYLLTFKSCLLIEHTYTYAFVPSNSIPANHRRRGIKTGRIQHTGRSNSSSSTGTDSSSKERLLFALTTKETSRESTGMNSQFNEEIQDHEHQQDGSRTKTTIKELCTYLNVTPKDLLSLSTSQNGDGGGERGVYLNNPVTKDEIILKIPLSSCIRDDKPPLWYDTYKTLHKHHDVDVDSENVHYNPSKWATRLAATLLDIQIRSDYEQQQKKKKNSNYNSNNNNKKKNQEKGLKKWLATMPDKDCLRASLPIHWPEELLSQTECTALELLVDASYFARAEAIGDLVAASNTIDDSDDHELWGGMDIDLSTYNIEEMASNIFDIVQTRSCRAERTDGIQLRPSLRILAPIFDYINHGSCHHEGEGSANAYFGLEVDADQNDIDYNEDKDKDEDEDEDANDEEDEKEKLSLVVRARRDIKANEEVLIDYGDSARPPFRCLASYGFVPKYHKRESDGDESVAEVYMDGVRYEVTSHTVPYEMVEAAAASYLEEQQGPSALYDEDVNNEDDNDETLLTPEVALRIAKRISDTAFQLLIDEESSKKKRKEKQSDISNKIGSKLASSLRWSQHQVLMACAVGLRDYAEGNDKD